MLDGIDSAVDDRAPGQLQALTSIIYAALSLETFINEIPVVMDNLFLDATSPLWLRTFVYVLDELEQSRAQIRTKYSLSKFILSGVSFDTSQPLYQHFDLLIDLRNEIVHQKPGDWRFGVDEKGAIIRTKRRILKKLNSINTLGQELPDESDEDSETVENWLDKISTRAMARWACKSSRNMILAILDAIPHGTVKDLTDTAYRAEFIKASQSSRILKTDIPSVE